MDIILLAKASTENMLAEQLGRPRFLSWTKSLSKTGDWRLAETQGVAVRKPVLAWRAGVSKNQFWSHRTGNLQPPLGVSGARVRVAARRGRVPCHAIYH